MQALTDRRKPAQTPALAGHIAGCAECQALRRSVLDRLLPGAGTPADTCAACEADLAAYIDALLDQGSAAAARAYPHVWWHLWACEDCADLFTQTAALAAAERSGALPPLPAARAAAAPARRVLGRLFVSSQVIEHFFQSRATLGVAYGSETPIILDESEDDEHSFQLSVRRQQDGGWQVLVSVIPPVAGVAVVTIGETTLQAPFGPLGLAQIDGVPAGLLSDGSRSISISIEAI
jgi:hypothetical protein